MCAARKKLAVCSRADIARLARMDRLCARRLTGPGRSQVMQTLNHVIGDARYQDTAQPDAKIESLFSASAYFKARHCFRYVG